MHIYSDYNVNLTKTLMWWLALRSPPLSSHITYFSANFQISNREVEVLQKRRAFGQCDAVVAVVRQSRIYIGQIAPVTAYVFIVRRLANEDKLATRHPSEGVRHRQNKVWLIGGNHSPHVLHHWVFGWF